MIRAQGSRTRTGALVAGDDQLLMDRVTSRRPGSGNAQMLSPVPAKEVTRRLGHLVLVSQKPVVAVLEKPKLDVRANSLFHERETDPVRDHGVEHAVQDKHGPR